MREQEPLAAPVREGQLLEPATALAERGLDQVLAGMVEQVECHEDDGHLCLELGRRADPAQAGLERGEVEDGSLPPRHQLPVDDEGTEVGQPGGGFTISGNERVTS